MNIIYYITMLLLLLCIMSNIFFLFHLTEYNRTYGAILESFTFIFLIAFILLAFLKKKKNTKKLLEQYEKFFHKN